MMASYDSSIKTFKKFFITVFHTVPPLAVKIAWNNIFSVYAACAAECGAIKRFNRFIEN